MIQSEHDEAGGSVRVAPSGEFLSYLEMSGLINAVARALSDPGVQTIEVDLSGIDEAGPALPGVLSLIRDLAEGGEATLTMNLGEEACRWLPETG